MSYNAIKIANAIIDKCRQKGINDINITKLHKLLYIIYGTYLYVHDSKLFDELPAYFQYGPIFKSLQKAYKKEEFELQGYKDVDDDVLTNPKLNEVIDKVLDTFGKYSAQQLSNWSHRDGSAWSKVDKMSDFWGVDIDDELIKGEFAKIVTLTPDSEE